MICIDGVEAYSKSGRHIILGKVVVDATGDGDVAVMAGAPYEKGRRRMV
ncbi:MAG: FAD-dependent oxidoreductase [Ignisphaera sp.]